MKVWRSFRQFLLNRIVLRPKHIAVRSRLLNEENFTLESYELACKQLKEIDKPTKRDEVHLVGGKTQCNSHKIVNYDISLLSGQKK